MNEKNVQMFAGGIANWGRAVPLRDKLTTVTYEADIITRLSVSEGPTTHFRSLYVGMDEVDVDGSTPHGFGTVRLEDPNSGDLLLGRVEWFMVDGKDKGTYTFEGGTGAWEGVSGQVSVDLEFCSRSADEPLNGGKPLVGLALIEGSGRLSFPE